MSYKPTPDYEEKTKKELVDLILTHDLITCYDSYDYYIENPNQPDTHKEISFLTCDLCRFSECVGSTVTRSNQRELYRLFKDQSGVTERAIGYSGVQTVFSYPTLKSWKKPNLIEFLETLDALTDYPLLDDEDLSNLESEIFTESWDNYISSDIITYISKLIETDSGTFTDHIEAQRLYDLSQDLNEPDYLYLPDPTIKTWRSEPHTPLTLLEAYHLYSDQTSDYPLYEDAVSAYVNTSAVAKWIHDNTTIIHRPADQTTLTTE
jgi:hypothetical protein